MKTLRIDSALAPVPPRDAWGLSREVFGVLGIPIDTVSLAESVALLQSAIEVRRPFLLSTPNVNFLILSRTDAGFRESLLLSDLCTVDGMPIVWIARLLGVSIAGRVSGADIFNELKVGQSAARRRSIFLFGGADEAAEEVGKVLNSGSLGLRCVGAFNPGFGSVEDLSQPAIVDRVNGTQADIVGVFLTARKAQAWLLKNHDALSAPVRAQFGATINFEAGTVRRAPALLRRAGFEWLWRIKEEPHLWRRYWADGLSLLRIVTMSALPLVAHRLWQRVRAPRRNDLTATIVDGLGRMRVCLSGAATEQHVAEAIACFQRALDRGEPFVVDLADTHSIDPRFFGLLLLVRKQLRKRGETLAFDRVPRSIRTMFHLNGFDFLLQTDLQR